MCWHKWTKWEEIERGEVRYGERYQAPYLAQERECEKCGKKQLRKEVAS